MIDKTIIDGAVDITQRLGFPIFVCWWFMFRMEKRIDRQTEVLLDVAATLKNVVQGDQEGG